MPVMNNLFKKKEWGWIYLYKHLFLKNVIFMQNIKNNQGQDVK